MSLDQFHIKISPGLVILLLLMLFINCRVVIITNKLPCVWCLPSSVINCRVTLSLSLSLSFLRPPSKVGGGQSSSGREELCQDYHSELLMDLLVEIYPNVLCHISCMSVDVQRSLFLGSPPGRDRIPR